MKKHYIPIMLILATVLMCACSNEGTPASSPSSSVVEEAQKEASQEIQADEAEKEETSEERQSSSSSSQSESKSESSTTTIYHGFETKDNETNGVFVHLTRRDDGEIRVTVAEYLYGPANIMFEMYDGQPTSASGSYVQLPRVDMRNIQFDADGRASLTVEGTVELHLSGDSLTYRAYGENFDFSFECSRITDEEYLTFMGWR